MRLPRPEPSLGQPREPRALVGNRLLDQRQRRVGNRASSLVQLGEIFGVLTPSAAKGEVEAASRDNRRCPAQQRHCRCSRFGFRRSTQTGFVEWKSPRRIQPGAVIRIDGAHWPEHGIRAGCLRNLHQLRQPFSGGSLVIIDEGQKISAAAFQTGIAGDGDIGGRAMDVGNVEGQLGGQGIDPFTRGRLDIVVGDNDPYRRRLAARSARRWSATCLPVRACDKCRRRRRCANPERRSC